MILDSTLREGEQTPGVYFLPHAKLSIASTLDKVGVEIIEAGHPAVDPEILDDVKMIASAGLSSKVGAHSRSLNRDVDLALGGCGIKDFLGMFYCVSENRLNGVFNKSFSEAIDKITETIAYARVLNSDLIIRYTPEDTVRSEFDNVVTASVEAVRSGANIISVADTTGYMVPGKRSMYDYVSRLKDSLLDYDVNPMIEVHCHNDRGLALANALDGYRAGAEVIDATVMGIGERSGIVDLASLLAVLKYDFEESNGWNLDYLKELYSKVSLYSGREVPYNLPLMGKHAFTHCAGVHTNAALKDPLHYESINPEIFSRRRKIALDHMSGKSSIVSSLENVGIELNDGLVNFVRGYVKKIGKTGRYIHGDDEIRDIVSLYYRGAEV